MDPQLAWVLLLTALNVGATVVSVSSARRAASFDLTRDFDAVVSAVAKLQRETRSEKMSRVRAGGSASEPPTPGTPAAFTPMSKEQLRAFARAKLTGSHQ